MKVPEFSIITHNIITHAIPNFQFRFPWFWFWSSDIQLIFLAERVMIIVANFWSIHSSAIGVNI